MLWKHQEGTSTMTGMLAGTGLQKCTNYDNALLGYGGTCGGASVNIARADTKLSYQKAYQRLAMYVMQPYATAVDGAMQILSKFMCQ